MLTTTCGEARSHRHAGVQISTCMTHQTPKKATIKAILLLLLLIAVKAITHHSEEEEKENTNNDKMRTDKQLLLAAGSSKTFTASTLSINSLYYGASFESAAFFARAQQHNAAAATNVVELVELAEDHGEKQLQDAGKEEEDEGGTPWQREISTAAATGAAEIVGEQQSEPERKTEESVAETVRREEIDQTLDALTSTTVEKGNGEKGQEEDVDSMILLPKAEGGGGNGGNGGYNKLSEEEVASHSGGLGKIDGCLAPEPAQEAPPVRYYKVSENGDLLETVDEENNENENKVVTGKKGAGNEENENEIKARGETATAATPPQCSHFDDLSPTLKARIIQLRLNTLSRQHQEAKKKLVESHKAREASLLQARDERLENVRGFWHTALSSLPNYDIYQVPFSQQVSAANMYISPEDEKMKTRVWRAIPIDDTKVFKNHLVGVQCRRFYPKHAISMLEARIRRMKGLVGGSSGKEGNRGEITAATPNNNENDEKKARDNFTRDEKNKKHQIAEFVEEDVYGSSSLSVSELESLLSSLRELSPEEEHFNISFRFSGNSLLKKTKEKENGGGGGGSSARRSSSSAVLLKTFSDEDGLPLVYRDPYLFGRTESEQLSKIPRTDDATISYPFTDEQSREISIADWEKYMRSERKASYSHHNNQHQQKGHKGAGNGEKEGEKGEGLQNVVRSSTTDTTSGGGSSSTSSSYSDTYYPKFFPFRHHFLSKFIAASSAMRSSRKYGDSSSKEAELETILRQHSYDRHHNKKMKDHTTTEKNDNNNNNNNNGNAGQEGDSLSVSPYNAYKDMIHTEMDAFEKQEWENEKIAELASVEEGMITIDSQIEFEVADAEREREREHEREKAKVEKSNKKEEEGSRHSPSPSLSLPLTRLERLEAFKATQRSRRAAERAIRRAEKLEELTNKLQELKKSRLSDLEQAWEKRQIDNNKHEFGIGTSIKFATDFIGVERDDVIPYTTGMNWAVEGSGLIPPSPLSPSSSSSEAARQHREQGANNHKNSVTSALSSGASSSSPPPTYIEDGRTLAKITARRKLLSRVLPVPGSFFSFFVPPEHFNHYSSDDKSVIKMRLYALLTDVCGPLTARPIDVYDTHKYEEIFRQEREREEALEAAALAELALEQLIRGDSEGSDPSSYDYSHGDGTTVGVLDVDAVAEL